MNKKSLVLALTFFILILLTFFIYGFWSGQLFKINLIPLVTATVCYFIIALIRSKKVHTIVKTYSPISYGEAVSFTGASQLTGAFVPGRAGEIVLSSLVKIKHGIDISKVLPTLFIDKFVELAFLVIYFFISALVFNQGILVRVSSLLKKLNFTSIIVLLVVLVVLAVVLTRLTGKLGKVNKLIHNLAQGLLLPIKSPLVGLTILGLSAVVLIIEYYYLYSIFRAFNINIDFTKIVIIHSIGMVIGVISLIPGGQGSTELSMVAVLALWGYSTKQTVLPIVTSKIVTYLVLLTLSFTILPQIKLILQNRKMGKENGSSHE